MNKNILFSLILASLITSIIALQIINFDNQNTSFSMTFTGNENITKNITFNKDADISSAYITMSSSPVYNLSQFANIGPGLTSYYNFTTNNKTTGSGDLMFSTCVFDCGYKTIASGSANGWSSVFYNDIPDCYNTTYVKTMIGPWNISQFLCVNDSLGIIRLMQFTMDGNYPYSYVNFTWENYSNFNYSRISNLAFNLDNNNSASTLCYQETANVSTSCGGLATGSYVYSTNYSTLANVTDGNYDTFSEMSQVGYQNILVNYTKPLSATNASVWQVKYGPNTDIQNLTIPSSCWNAYADKLVLRMRAFSRIATDTIEWDCYTGSAFINIQYTFNTFIYEEAMIWSIPNSNIYSYSGTFNITATSRDFSRDIDLALNNGNCDCLTCTLSSNNCTIGFNFHSDTSGILNINNLSIQWIESVKPSLIILNPINRTYNASSFPLHIIVSDNYLMNNCLYWITKNGVITTSNTTWDCSNITVGQSASGDYTINVCANDIFNNQNCSNQNFSMNVPIVEGGGGGSLPPPVQQQSATIGITEPNAGNWTVSTDGLTANYDLQMTTSSSREKQLLFENFGTLSRHITLRCQNLNGDLCKYAEFVKEFDLPVLTGIKTTKSVNVVVPEDFENGEYKFNIFATDDKGNEQVITFQTTVGNFGLITGFAVKLGSSANINGFNVPYLLIGLFIGAASWIFSFALLHKKNYGASLSFIIGLITLISAILII